MYKKYCYWFIFQKIHYLWSKYRFKSSPPNENGAEHSSMIVPQVDAIRVRILQLIYSSTL